MKEIINTLILKIVDYALTGPYTKNVELIHEKVVKRIEKGEAVFFTEHKRPKKSTAINIKPQESIDIPSTAVVLQGPLIEEDDFTFETILLYKKNFPSSIIILSTWNDEDNLLIEKIKTNGIIVLQNERPVYEGMQNINYQIASSAAGILRAKELGARYVLKSRTDQRIHALNVIDYFLSLIESFPIQGVIVQKQRLIALSLNTFLYRLYGVSDMCMFGNIDDMLLYWNINHDERNLSIDMLKKWDLESYSELKLCEMYLCTEFMKKTGKEILWTLEDSWEVIANQFCIVDYHSIDIYWPKYLPHCEFRNKYYNSNNTHQLMSFSYWLSLYSKKIKPPALHMNILYEGEAFVL